MLIRQKSSKLLFLLILFSTLLTVSCLTHYQYAFAEQSQDQWAARPMNVIPLAGSLTPRGYSPSQIKTAYGLPESGGAETTIAIIDAYDTPSIMSDLSTFSSQFNLPAPTSSNFEIHKMAPNLSTDDGWGKETALDVEWAHAIAPNAKILLVEAKSNLISDLRSAVNYARNRPDVVSVSMSWGGDEYAGQKNFDSLFTSSFGAVFFASSGDNGSSEIIWPATSPNVVAVGGTTLNLNSEGNVISETGWSGSGGGASIYENMPSYQLNYGLTGSKRTVPDVSYNADPATGVAVCYNSLWYQVGGTSAGAPQWAAIQALGRSASNMNLYQKAKQAYAAFFRDVTSGSNGGYVAGSGYDLVTGLGSPLTVNFASTLTVFPTSGPAGGEITLSGSGFSDNSIVNLAYQNPVTGAWVSLESVSTVSNQLQYTFKAPDLMQNNLAGDNSPLFNNITFAAIENETSYLSLTATPYTEYRRGLTQVAVAFATGVFGNNTDLSMAVYAEATVPFAVSGKWFQPGIGNIFVDNSIYVGAVAINDAGSFTLPLTLPIEVNSGQHTVTLYDGSANFTFTITAMPTIISSFNDIWHTENFSISLNPTSNGIANIYYSINNQQIQNINANGQPKITTESGDNTLEFWGVYSSGVNLIELSHRTLSGIKLDKTPPEGTLLINDGANATSLQNVTLSLTAADVVSGVKHVRFSNDGNWDNSQWESPSSSRSWILSDGEGLKTVYCQIEDYAGLQTTVNASISLSTIQPQVQPTATPTDSGGNLSVIPELPSLNIVTVLLILAATSTCLIYKKQISKQ